MDLNEIGKTLLILFLSYYFMDMINLFRSKIRKEVKEKNKQLNELRTKTIKSVEEQKEFINLKYPKSNFKWSWGMIPSIIFGFVKFIGMFFLFRFLLKNVQVSLITAICIIIGLPILMNFILKRFNLNKPDTTDVLFKWNKNRKI